MNQCKLCGKEYKYRHDFCSRACEHIYTEHVGVEYVGNGPLLDLTCVYCGNRFQSRERRGEEIPPCTIDCFRQPGMLPAHFKMPDKTRNLIIIGFILATVVPFFLIIMWM